MNARDAFGVVLRTCGLFVLARSASGFLIAFDLQRPSSALGAVVLIALGLWLLRGAAPLLSFAYPSASHRGGRARSGGESPAGD